MKTILLIIFIVSLIFIAGCGQQNQQNQQEIYSGTEGVKMRFLTNTPPSEVFDRSGLVVLIEYTNAGAYPITNGALYLTGYDPSYLFGSVMSKGLGGLHGKSLMYPKGETKVVEFSDSSIGKPEHIDSFEQKLKLTACYKYMTMASTQVCIDPEPYAVGGGKKTCTPGLKSLSGGQGAPVAVTKIDERIADNIVYFDIHFKNMGSGEAFVGGTNQCYTSLSYNEINRVQVKSVMLSNKRIGNCEPSLGSSIILTNGEGFIKCYTTISRSGDEYLTNLDVELEYSYRQSAPLKTINIISAPGR